MARKQSVALIMAAVFLVSGCASLGQSGGASGRVNWTCVLIGGLLGGGAGALAANSNHGDDDDNQAGAAAAVGAVLGGAIGHAVCARTNQPPTAQLSAEPPSGEAPLRVAFRGTGRDVDGSITSYAWDFGDGASSSEQHPTHVYSNRGSYMASLRVTDNDGATGSASGRIVVGAARPAEAPGRIVLRGINFAFDSARIEPEFAPVLDVAVDELRANPGVSVEVAGHTDHTGSDEYNQGLSERRARSVVDYLVGKGIDASRLDAAGYGESRPVADNATRDGRAQNRRVELNVR